MWLFLFSLLIVSILSIIMIKKRAFDYIAVLISALFGVIIINLRGIRWFSVMVLFLVVALYATYFGKVRKYHEKRGADNVISNGMVAFVASILNLPYMFSGSLAAALSDTMSSEIGVLSKSNPVLITNPTKRVPKGTNGAVSVLGFLAGMAGASIIGIFSTLLLFGGEWKSALIIAISGMAGNVLDSFLGICENDGKLSNGTVNFLATLFGGTISVVIHTLS